MYFIESAKSSFRASSKTARMSHIVMQHKIKIALHAVNARILMRVSFKILVIVIYLRVSLIVNNMMTGRINSQLKSFLMPTFGWLLASLLLVSLGQLCLVLVLAMHRTSNASKQSSLLRSPASQKLQNNQHQFQTLDNILSKIQFSN